MDKGIVTPRPKTPEVYRMTPFEFAVTAEPRQLVLNCAREIAVPGSTAPRPVNSATFAIRRTGRGRSWALDDLEG